LVIRIQIKNGKENVDIVETNGRLVTNAIIKNYILVKQRKNQTHLKVILITKVKRKVMAQIQYQKRPCPRYPW
jgi:hypothetical protein